MDGFFCLKPADLLFSYRFTIIFIGLEYIQKSTKYDQQRIEVRNWNKGPWKYFSFSTVVAIDRFASSRVDFTHEPEEPTRFDGDSDLCKVFVKISSAW